MINPLELFQHNLIHQVPFAMRVAIGKVHAEYHDPVGIRKAMDSSTVGCSYKLGCIYVKSYNFFQRLLISKVKYLLVDNCLYQMDLPFRR